MKDEQLARTMREIIDMASRTMFKEAGCTNEAVNLAKAYADARESKEIAELKAVFGFLQDKIRTRNSRSRNQAVEGCPYVAESKPNARPRND